MSKQRQIRTSTTKPSKNPPAATVKQTNQAGDLSTSQSFEEISEEGVVAAQAARLQDTRLTAVQRQRLALRIGRVQGNQHLQRALAEPQARAKPVLYQANTPPSPEKPQAIQRFLFDNRTDQEKIRDAIKDRSQDTVKAIGNYNLATPGERFTLIEILLDQGWVGPSDESALERIWGTFGEGAIEYASQPSFFNLWKRCVDRGAELDDLPVVGGIKKKFASDVERSARNYLDANKAYIEQEMDRLGLNDTTAAPTVAQENELKVTQEVAKMVADAQGARGDFERTPIGYDAEVTDMPGGGMQSTIELAYFTPLRPPMYKTHPYEKKDVTFPAWEEIKKSYDELGDLTEILADQYPSVYALLRQDSDSVGKAAEASPEQARAAMGKALREVLGNIKATYSKIGGDIEYYDLQPIHAQLLHGLPGPASGLKWDQPFLKWAAEDDLSDHEARDFWISLGLGTLAAAAFIFAEIASGGTATFFLAAGLGLSGAQAGISWEKYLDLAQAADTNVKRDLAIVSQGQVNTALVSAILDTAFALLDLYGPAKAGYRALRGAPVIGEMARAGAAAGKSALKGLEALGEMSQAEAQQVLERSLAEAGVEETARRSGKSVDELLGIVGPESAAGKRLQDYKGLANVGLFSAEELAAKLKDIKAGKSFGLLEDDRIFVQAIEQYGPAQAIREGGGWKHLANTLGNGSQAGQRLFAWREGIWQDVKRFVTEELKGQVERTGSQGNITNDLDMSFLGKDAAANSNKARSFLAGRMGVSPGEIEKLLNGSLFTDPRRMHLYDLPELAVSANVRKELAQKAAAYEEQLIWSYRLKLAQEAGDEGLVAQLRKQMDELGVKSGPIIPLNKGDVAKLYEQVDQLHGQLEEAIKAGDAGRQAQLIEQISQKQAYINLIEKEGYMSGGGVRAQVTGREADKVAEFAGALAKEALPQQVYTNVLDQLPKLQQAAEQLLKSPATQAELRDAIKGVGKYGGRFRAGAAEIIEKLGVAVPDETVFEELAKAAKSKGPLPPDLAQKASTALAQLEGAHSQVLQKLRQLAALEGVEASMTKVQLLTAAHIKLIRARNAVYQQIIAAAKAAKTVGVDQLEPDQTGEEN